jgi:cAMP-dependent protein kinase regulator
MVRRAPPGLPGSSGTAESPIDRALSLALAEEREAALRWAAAIVKSDLSMPTALALCGRLLGDLGRHEVAREASAIAVARAIDLENLPLAVTAARQMERLGGDSGRELDRIAEAFCKGSPRLGEGSPPPPPLPPADSFQPLASVLTGASLLNKTTEIVHEAKKKLGGEKSSPGIAAVPLFSAIGRTALRALIATLEPIWVAAGNAVIQQGAEGSEAYFVARGELEVRRLRDGETVVLARLSNGALFGEMALLSRAPRTGSVVATRPSIVLEVKREALDKLAEAQPEVGVQLAAHTRSRMFQNLERTTDFLRVVPGRDRAVLVERFTTRTFEKNETLLRQGEAASGLFLIASGEVAIVHKDEVTAGDPLVLSTLGPGDVVGEVATVLRRVSSMDAVAVHPTVTLHLSKEEFMNVIHDHPSILLELYKLAIERDAYANSVMESEFDAAEDFTLV